MAAQTKKPSSTPKPAAKTSTKPAAKKAAPDYTPCEECGAPLDSKQRYCVSCGNRRKDTGSPSVNYFQASAKRSRRTSGGRPVAPQTSGGRAAAVIFFVLLPLAVAVGILVGRGGSDDNDDLIAAIQDAAANGGTGGTLASTTAGATIASDFSLDKGYTVKVSTLPAEGTDQAAVDAAKAEATKGGAADVGVISPSDFTMTPDQGGAYVIYSGEFKSKGEATKALGKLKAKFKDAEVIQVTRAAGGDQGKLLEKTQFGDVHQVEGFKPSASKVASDQQVVDDIAKKIGQDYVGAQKDLPDVIVVGGNGGGPAPTGPDN